MLGKRTTSDLGAVKINSIIGTDTVFEGTISTKETTRIDGIVKGEIKSEGTLVIGNSGKVVGNVHAANIVIAGSVEGDLYATGKIEVSSTSKIRGDINTKSLIIDEDALFEGKCTMNTDEQKNDLTQKIEGVKNLKPENKTNAKPEANTENK